MATVARALYAKIRTRSRANLGHAYAAGMRMLPYRWRYAVAKVTAALCTPLLKLVHLATTTTVHRRIPDTLEIETLSEAVLYLTLHTMTKHGVLFEPKFRVDSVSELERAGANGRGVLVIAPHARLSILFLRLLHDRGMEADVFSHVVRTCLGTIHPVRTLPTHPTSLLRARSVLARGGMVAAMIDSQSRAGRRVLQYDVGGKQLNLVSPLIRIAHKCDADVLLLMGRLDTSGEIILSLRCILAGCPPNSVAEQFAQFLAERSTHSTLTPIRETSGRV